jgi:hypothetical protein
MIRLLLLLKEKEEICDWHRFRDRECSSRRVFMHHWRLVLTNTRRTSLVLAMLSKTLLNGGLACARLWRIRWRTLPLVCMRVSLDCASLWSHHCGASLWIVHLTPDIIVIMVSISTKMRRGVAETLSRPTHQLTASHWHARCVAEVATAMHHQGGHDAYVGMIGLGCVRPGELALIAGI